ncbi:lysine N(6)-hydroxylase/L-ornithine N(5)-oxygenase family protein [Marinibactrum halimedae]|uniref:Lysine N6-hydroxylase/L-ornithine N5-oxygenase family protein n=1 Tax=Marinibactrum halimedae TaxID=1444977 RepID=A0AA37WNW2_9GAMM|nr:SidA/IucD/PvdA family monooxygenase [Marinibactrum halimedae]MCD9458591.1 SidA/IucD/PvdA family monooxygenase [Marinibactrum halimedae]GLS26541.1 lysine N6-hydroxylase/L-ornithine N5-oxygenase family protein [Marinibactrum halimedae]
MIYDVIGIGVGPFNLSLAALTSNLSEVKTLFLDQRSGFDWHPGLMIEGVHLQTPFMSDLVTLADPTHPLSFLNYSKQKGRLYSFYIREDFFLLRQEYNAYCQWAVKQIPSIQWGKRVEVLRYVSQEAGLDSQSGHYEVTMVDVSTGKTETVCAKKVVLGTGPKPFIPESCRPLLEKNEPILHSSDYLYQKAQLQSQRKITVVGSGQSAAEIFYDLLSEIDQYNYELNWITSAPRFYPLEYTKLTLEMTSPEYVDYFHALPREKRDQLVASQKNLYKGINGSLIDEIFEILYRKRLNADRVGQDLPVTILTNSKVVSVQENKQKHDNHQRNPEVVLDCYHSEQEKDFSITTEGLVLATGFHYQEPAFLSPIKDRIRYDGKQRFDVNRNYSIDKSGQTLFVQNAELHTHGFVSPDLGMACYRNSILIKEITGVEHYPIEERIAFQHFGVPEQTCGEKNENVLNASHVVCESIE